LQKSLRDLFQKFSSAPRGLGFCADRPVYEGVGVDKTSNFWYNNYGKENEGINKKKGETAMIEGNALGKMGMFKGVSVYR